MRVSQNGVTVSVTLIEARVTVPVTLFGAAVTPCATCGGARAAVEAVG